MTNTSEESALYAA